MLCGEPATTFSLLPDAGARRRGDRGPERRFEMSIVKVHRYGVRTRSVGPQCLDLEAPGKPPLRVALPPEYKNGVRGVWSPEELLIASLAACFELTVAALAAYKDVPLYAVKVDATGHVERKD